MTFDLRNLPRPNFEEMPSFYDELDELAKRVEAAIRNLKPELFNTEEEVIFFNKMTKNDLVELIKKDPEAMVPALTKVCGLSVRQFERLHNLRDVYRLRSPKLWRVEKLGRNAITFVEVILEYLNGAEMHLETFIYTFYKLWEEERKRFVRGRKAEEELREFLRQHGYSCGKITAPVEIDVAILPSKNPSEVRVVMPVRTGVRRDLVKRAKEFSRECDEFRRNFPNAKVVVMFRIPRHELDRKDEIRGVIAEQRAGLMPYDGIFFQDELQELIRKLEMWRVPKSNSY